MIPDLIAFAGTVRIADGPASVVALAAKAALDREPHTPLFVFERETARPIDLDLRGSADDILARLPPIEVEPARGPGRPRLGVVAREVTLLPRHWDWLAAQPGGASVTLRKLVDEARHASEDKDRIRLAREAAYRFMSAMAGNETHFEEAIRALFAGDAERFASLVRAWPEDIRAYAQVLVRDAF